MLSENLVKAFNAQINAEMWSSNLYLSMSVYFAQNGYDGMASWMRAIKRGVGSCLRND